MQMRHLLIQLKKPEPNFRRVSLPLIPIMEVFLHGSEAEILEINSLITFINQGGRQVQPLNHLCMPSRLITAICPITSFQSIQASLLTTAAAYGIQKIRQCQLVLKWYPSGKGWPEA